MVKTTVMGWIWVTTTRGVVLEAVTRLPGIDEAETHAAGNRRVDVGKAQLHLVDTAKCPDPP